MYSIFHFWKHLVQNKRLFSKISTLNEFAFDGRMLSYRNDSLFPDMAIKLNKNNSIFTGGELIELKDSKTYNVSSFNSTIPTGKKNIRNIISSERGKAFSQMREAGDDVFSLEDRDVYYLVRGRRGKYQKICLVHGSFFETISVKELIRHSFAQVLGEKLLDMNVANELKERLEAAFSEQADFSRGRNVEKASVKLRFRVMTEVKPEGKILNSKQYPQIVDDSLNFLAPYHNEDEKLGITQKMEIVMGERALKNFKIFSLKHPLNGLFLVFQVDL